MDSSLRIAWMTAELDPFVKIGGLADVSSALPKALSNQGHELIIVLPYYTSIDQDGIEESGISFTDPRGEVCVVHQSFLTNSPIRVYLLEHPLFEGEPYEYHDLGNRFATFSWLGTRLFDNISWYPHIIHANDWHTALMMPFLRNVPVKTVFTIHNIGYQGYESSQPLKELRYGDLVLEGWDKINYMELGIKFADQVTTVSSTYAKEILTEEYSYGLDSTLRSHKRDIRGIVHGIDLDEYNPKGDNYIVHNYSIESISQKRQNKLTLQQQADIPQNEEIFTLGFISRLVEQKGVNLLIDAIPELVQHNIQIFVLGTGENHYERELQRIKYAYSDKIGLFLTYDVELSHRIFAGVDAFLVPSKYEPCGLTQLYSMAYGTIPIVRETGGLADTVSEGSELSNGFVFENFSASDLIDAISRAMDLYYSSPETWKQLQHAGMSADLSWNKPAREWSALYRKLLS